MHKKITPAASAIDKVKGSREKKKQERQTKLAEMMDDEVEYEKTVKPKKSNGNFSYNFGGNSGYSQNKTSNIGVLHLLRG